MVGIDASSSELLGEFEVDWGKGDPDSAVGLSCGLLWNSHVSKNCSKSVSTRSVDLTTVLNFHSPS